MPTSQLDRVSLIAALAVALFLGGAAGARGATPAAEPAAADAALLEDEELESAGKASLAPDPAAEPYWQALKLLRGTNRAEWRRARELLQESADLEFTHAQNYLGLCHLGGNYDFPKDPRKAGNLFRLAAERGNAFAMLNLGLCYLNGTGMRKDRAKAMQWLLAATAADADYTSPPPPADFYAPVARIDGAATGTLSGALPTDPADQSRALAHFNLGEIYTQGGEAAKAHPHYVKAAMMGPAGRAGIYQAALKAASGFAFGQGVPRDLAKANEMLDQSRKLSRRLSIAYAHSLVEQKLFDDFAQADLEEALSAETEKTQRKLQFDIAGSFADPKSKNYDAREAIKWYEIAAEGGEPAAMLSLAFGYSNGQLGEKDPVKAFEWFKQAAETGESVVARANLGICYQAGFGTPVDVEKAAEIFRTHRNESFVCYLGTIGAAPTAAVTADQELELNIEWAKRRDAHAQYLMGRRYLYGLGVEMKIATALDWLERAGKASHPRALCELGWLYENPKPEWRQAGPFASHGISREADLPARAAQYYRAGMEAGDVDATASLALLYQNGHGVPQDDDQAVALYEKCLKAEPSHQQAHNNLAVIFEKRFREAAVRHDQRGALRYRDRMLDHLKEAHRAGFWLASRNLGSLAYEGSLGERNFQEAYNYFQSATEQGDPVAHRMLGQMHENGEGVPVTYREAAYHYRLAALGGDYDALVRLCDFYLAGKGVSRDYERAAFWLKHLAHRGDIRAVTALGDLMLQREEYASALKVFRDLRNSPDPRLVGYAHERLARMYERGWGVKASASKAKSYRARALRLNNADAAYAHAVGLIREGKKSDALPLLYRAAAGGQAAACYTLGYLHLAGDGVPQDVTKGWGYMSVAARGGNLEAQYALAAGALNNAPGSPPFEEALEWAERAEAAGYAPATAVRERLEQMRKKRASAAASAASAKR